MVEVLIFFAIHWYGSLFFQTFFLHRYAAHQQFTMSKFTERVFYILTFIFQGSNYLSAYAYGLMHRMHHAYADTEKDPHSPKFDKSIMAMMFRTASLYGRIRKREYIVDEKFQNGHVPDWRSFDDFASLGIVRFAWGALYTFFYIYFVPTEMWYLYLLLPVHYLMSPIHGVIINWFAHKIGYINFKVNDTSKNLMIWDLFMMGEGLHNNHHTHGESPNFAQKKIEFDPTYPVIRILDFIGVIKLTKRKSKKREIEPTKTAPKAA